MHDNSHGELCQCQTLLTVPSAWLINTLLSPYQAKKGVGESTQAMIVLYVMSAKRHCQMLVLGTATKPKKYTSYRCSICKRALCIDPCFRLYHTEKDYTSEIIKIARRSVKPIQIGAQHVLKRHHNPNGIIYVLTV